MGSSLRYLGFAVGFGFAVVWMTVSLGAAIVCLLVAALGYGAVFMVERAQAARPPKRTPDEALSLPAEGLELDRGRHDELPDDATTPLAAEAEYGWPWPRADHEEDAEQDRALAARERG